MVLTCLWFRGFVLSCLLFSDGCLWSAPWVFGLLHILWLTCCILVLVFGIAWLLSLSVVGWRLRLGLVRLCL